MAKTFHAIQKAGDGKYNVIRHSTGKPINKHPESKKDALAELRAIEWAKHSKMGK